MELDEDELRITQNNYDFNYSQKLWYKEYMILQNCGFDSFGVGIYNGITIFKAINNGSFKDDEFNYKAIFHLTLKGNKQLTINELIKLIENHITL